MNWSTCEAGPDPFEMSEGALERLRPFSFDDRGSAWFSIRRSQTGVMRWDHMAYIRVDSNMR